MLRNVQSFWWKLTQLFVTFKIFFYNESREVLYQIVKDQHSGDLTLFIWGSVACVACVTAMYVVYTEMDKSCHAVL